MAPNARSNLHVDAYQTDDNRARPARPRDVAHETFLDGDCASVTFDSRGRIVTVCVGVEGPTLFMLDATTLDTLATFPLPPREPGGGNIFNDFAGGGYFYLDERGPGGHPDHDAPPLRGAPGRSPASSSSATTT